METGTKGTQKVGNLARYMRDEGCSCFAKRITLLKTHGRRAEDIYGAFVFKRSLLR